MRTRLKSRKVVFFAAGSFTAALLLAGVAHAVTDTIFQYSTPQTGYLTLPAAAFTPESSSVTYTNLGGQLGPLTNAEDSCFHASVNLPNGANMGALAVWYESDSESIEFTILLQRQYLTTGLNQNIISKSLSSSNDAHKGVSFSIPAQRIVDNQHYSYFVRTCMSGSAASSLFAVRLTYTYTNAGS